jgi:hypothetical protein
MRSRAPTGMSTLEPTGSTLTHTLITAPPRRRHQHATQRSSISRPVQDSVAQGGPASATTTTECPLQPTHHHQRGVQGTMRTETKRRRLSIYGGQSEGRRPGLEHRPVRPLTNLRVPQLTHTLITAPTSTRDSMRVGHNTSADSIHFALQTISSSRRGFRHPLRAPGTARTCPQRDQRFRDQSPLRPQRTYHARRRRRPVEVRTPACTVHRSRYHLHGRVDLLPKRHIQTTATNGTRGQETWTPTAHIGQTESKGGEGTACRSQADGQRAAHRCVVLVSSRLLSASRSQQCARQHRSAAPTRHQRIASHLRHGMGDARRQRLWIVSTVSGTRASVRSASPCSNNRSPQVQSLEDGTAAVAPRR